MRSENVSPQVVISKTRATALLIHAAMQRCEIGYAVFADPEVLGIKNCTAFDLGSGRDNARIAFPTSSTPLIV